MTFETDAIRSKISRGGINMSELFFLINDGFQADSRNFGRDGGHSRQTPRRQVESDRVIGERRWLQETKRSGGLLLLESKAALILKKRNHMLFHDIDEKEFDRRMKSVRKDAKTRKRGVDFKTEEALTEGLLHQAGYSVTVPAGNSKRFEENRAKRNAKKFG